MGASQDEAERTLDELQPPRKYWPFFPVATHKFVLMSLCTFGFYELYWCFKNWQRIKERSAGNIKPFWRAFFAPIWVYDLFRNIHQYAEERNIRAKWSAGFLAVGYIVFLITARLGLLSLISFASFVPFVPVVKTVAEINAKNQSAEGRNNEYSGADIAMLIIGGLLLILGIIGTLAVNKR